MVGPCPDRTGVLLRRGRETRSTCPEKQPGKTQWKGSHPKPWEWARGNQPCRQFNLGLPASSIETITFHYLTTWSGALCYDRPSKQPHQKWRQTNGIDQPKMLLGNPGENQNSEETTYEMVENIGNTSDKNISICNTRKSQQQKKFNDLTSQTVLQGNLHRVKAIWKMLAITNHQGTQIEVTMNYQCTSVRMPRIEKTKDGKCWRGCGRRETCTLLVRI